MPHDISPVRMRRRHRSRNGKDALVTLTTDFGLEGHHAGVLKGVILGLNPKARLVDLSHAIPPGDTAAAAWILLWSWRYFPAGTIHLIIVDPGVGGPRRPLAAQAGDHFFVGPDNGVLDPVLTAAGEQGMAVINVPEPSSRSSTFHGRDIFAPVAGRLSLGITLTTLGKKTTDRVCLALPQAHRIAPGTLAGEVIAVDRWGNLVTSITAAAMARAGIGPRARIRIGRRMLQGLGAYYAQVPPGEPIALINSNGHLEIAVSLGRADEKFHAKPGKGIIVSSERHRLPAALEPHRSGKD